MSSFKTLSDLTQEVISNLSMYPGTSVQIYAEDRISNMIIRLFSTLFEERFWSDTTFWREYTLSGIDGVVNEDVSKDIAHFHDIECIKSQYDTSSALTKLHSSFVPQIGSGKTPCFYTNTPIENKIFAVVPFTATGKIYVRARTRPTEFLPDTIIPFDSTALVFGVCYEYSVDDDNNKAASQKFKELFDKRINQLNNLENSGIYDYNDDGYQSALYSWR